MRRVPVAAAVAASAVVAGWGNGVVLASRRGGGEALTLVAHPAAALAGTVLLLRAGFSRRDLGLARPRWAPGHRAAGPLTAAVAGAVAALAVVALVGGDGALRLRVARLLVATAAGEEVIHRGLVLAVWAATGRSTRTVVLANAVTFTAWHVAAATHDGSLRWVELAVPAAGTVPFLWARCRSGSVVPAAVLHAATNLPGLVARHL